MPAPFITVICFDSESSFDNFDTKLASNIRDWTGKVDFDLVAGQRSQWHWGALYTTHKFTPRTSDFQTTDEDDITFESGVLNEFKNAREAAVYGDYETDLSKKIRLDVGLRLSMFQQVGPYTIIENENGSKDTTIYATGEKVKDWYGLEPRIGLRYRIDSVSSVKAAFNVNNQYVHLISLSGNALPFDVWIPSSALVDPQRGVQYSAGYFRKFKHNTFETSAEVFYRTMTNQIEYRQDYVPQLTGELENDLVFGKGKAYGIEFLFRKNKGKTQGWIGYTLAKTDRIFDLINGGKIFPARYDRRHDISLVATHKLNERWTFGGTFVYGTGQAITIAEGKYLIEGTVINQYGPRNGFRMPAYHRLDLAATLMAKKTAKFESSWTFSIYKCIQSQKPLYHLH